MNPEHKKYILENITKKSIRELASDLDLKERKVRKFVETEKQKKIPADFKEETKTPARPFDKTIVLLSVALIIILGLAVYANSLNGKFLYDDENLIKDNAFIKEWSFIPKIFSEDIGKATGITYTFYRPIQIITYAIDYHVWKLNVVGYHLTNIILHILVVLCIYWFVCIFFSDKTISILTAILFVVHPIHTTVVSYISTRAESLYLLFLLVSFIFYIKSLKSNSVFYYLITISSYSLSLLSKENALILPALLLLYHFTFKEKVRMREFLSVSGAAGLYIVLRMTVLKHLMVGHAYKSAFFERIPGFFIAIAEYLRLLFLPFGLHIEYGERLFGFNDPRAICGLVILVALIFCILNTRKTNRLIFFSLSWFIITLLPVSNLYPLNAYMSENWLYLPSIGFFLVIAGLLSPFLKKEKTRISLLIFTSCLLAFYSYLTVRQNETWKDPILFYERTLKYAPRSTNVLINLGTAYDNMGRKEEAIAMFKKAIEINPDQAAAYNNLGIVYNKMERMEKSVAMFNKALELNPNDAKIYSNLGSAYDKMGKKEEAVAMFKKAMEINPDQPSGYASLGVTYAKMGKKEEAAAMFNKALELNPNDAKACYNLGTLYDKMGKKEEAIYLYEKAIEINPSYAAAYGNLGGTYYEIGKKEKAIALFKKLIEIDPDYADAYNNLGFAYYEIGKKEEAIALYKKAIELNSNYAGAYTNLGAAYFELGRREEAAAAFKKALEINPDSADARRNLEIIETGSK
ncbi:MAG: tetratricopeptide repeat protein [Candidatus Omnitrophica bacterium]|nr:tetratricopeptide repeat protein [Candidatus Omnitrophota bacterium]